MSEFIDEAELVIQLAAFLRKRSAFDLAEALDVAASRHKRKEPMLSGASECSGEFGGLVCDYEWEPGWQSWRVVIRHEDGHVAFDGHYSADDGFLAKGGFLTKAAP